MGRGGYNGVPAERDTSGSTTPPATSGRGGYNGVPAPAVHTTQAHRDSRHTAPHTHPHAHFLQPADRPSFGGRGGYNAAQESLSTTTDGPSHPAPSGIGSYNGTPGGPLSALAEGPAPAGRGGYNAAPGGTPLAMALPLPNHVGTGGYQAAAAAPVAPASAVATSSVATLAEPNPLGNDHHHGEGDLQDSD